MGEARLEQMKSNVVVYPIPLEPGVEQAADLSYRRRRGINDARRLSPGGYH